MGLFEVNAYVGLLLFGFASIILFAQISNVKIHHIIQQFGWLSYSIATFCTVVSCFAPSDSIYLPKSYLILCASIGGVAMITSLIFKSTQLATYSSPLLCMILALSFYDKGQNITFSGDQFSKILLTAHITTAMIGQGCVVIAGFIAGLFIIQNRFLKMGQFNKILPNIPSLESLEKSLGLLLWVGFTGICTTLIFGSLFTYRYVTELTPEIRVKIYWACAVLLYYMAIIILKSTAHVGRQTIAWLAIAGFVILALTLFGLGFGPLI